MYTITPLVYWQLQPAWIQTYESAAVQVYPAFLVLVYTITPPVYWKLRPAWIQTPESAASLSAPTEAPAILTETNTGCPLTVQIWTKVSER